MNPGQANQGNNQMQEDPGQATGSGSNTNQQGNSQNLAAPGQGNRPGGFGNATAFMPGSGNMTPPDKPTWDPANMTAMNNTAWHGHHAGNMTDIPPPGNWDPANTTAMNDTAWHGDGNMTPPIPPVQGNAPGQDQQQVQNLQQTHDQLNSTGDLIAQFLEWLKARGST